MAFFKQFYAFLEKNFFNSLTKKLVGNFLFLLLAQGMTILVIYFGNQAIHKELQGTAVSPAVVQAVTAISASTFHWALVLYAVMAVIFAAILLFMRFLFIRPVRQLIEFFSMSASGEGDLSIRIPKITYDEFGELAETFNQFLASLRRMFLNVRMMGVNIAVNAAKVTRKVENSAENAGKQGELSRDIFAGSKETTAAHGEISNNTQEICASTSNNLETAKGSFQELITVSGNIHSMNDKLANYTETITSINAESQDIKNIVSLIKTISTQTSLLSLNAAIEAARAGKAGKGFSIVADEVKKLAEQVNAASENIADKINSVVKRIEVSMEESKEVAQFAQVTQEAVDKSCRSFQGMMEEFEKSDSQLQGITASVEELSASNEEIHSKVSTINTVSQEVGMLMKEADEFSKEMMSTTENMQELVSQFKIGEGYLETAIFKTKEYRDKAQEIMEQMLRKGIDVFDRNYQPITGTDPQKYNTVYDAYFESDLRPLYDRMLAEIEGGLYVVAIDFNGYAPTHCSKYAKPLTGDYQTDLVGSRDKRFFTDPTGIRCVQHTKRVLVQTYMRDTGEILSDISMPVMVGGKHWGGFRLGIDPAVLLRR